MSREEKEEDDIVCLDESFFINDEWVSLFFLLLFMYMYIQVCALLYTEMSLVHSLQLPDYRFYIWVSCSSALLPPIFFKLVFFFF